MASPIIQQINAELEALQKELGQFKSTVEYLNGAKNQVKVAVQTVNYAEENFNEKVEELKNIYDSFIELSNSVTAVIAKIETVNFPERLDNIEKAIKYTFTYLDETKEATLYELQNASRVITNADFDGHFKMLQDSIDASVKSNESLLSSIKHQDLLGKLQAFEQNLNEKLETSVSNLQKNTEQIASDTEKSVRDLKLPDKLQAFERNLNEKLETSVSNLQKNTEQIASDTEKSVRDLKLPDKLQALEQNFNEKLETSVSNLQKNTEQIASDTAKSIFDLNLNVRIDKLDANISGILSAVQNVQSRIESVERNISGRLKDNAEKQVSANNIFQENIYKNIFDLKKELNKSIKKQNTISYLTWILIVLGVVAIIFI